jgi:hypothetical protein
MQNWQPPDTLKLIALLGGFVLCGLGAYMMWLGVGAEGSVDLKSAVMSGSVKTGSAGLFLIFFGSAIVLFVLATLTVGATAKAAAPALRRTAAHSIGIAFFVILFTLVVSAAAGAMGYGSGFGYLAGFLGFVLLCTAGAYAEFASRE